jgi:hypothetical protein
MTRTHWIRTLVAFSLAAGASFAATVAITSGCNKGDAATMKSAPGAEAAAPTKRVVTATGPIKASIAGEEVVFTSAVADENGDSATIYLSSSPNSCDDQQPDAAYRASVRIPHGPGNKMFSGRDLPVEVWLSAPEGKDHLDKGDLGERYGAVSLESFEWKKGEHVKGALDFAKVDDETKQVFKGMGTFDAVVCNDFQAPKHPAPDAVRPGPLAGSVHDQPFNVGSILAVIENDEASGLQYLERLEVYPQAGITCATRLDTLQKTKGQVFFSQSAVTSRRQILGTPVPAILSMDATSFDGSVWMQIDHADLKAGGKLTGKIAALVKEANHQADLSGSFEATVCEWR